MKDKFKNIFIILIFSFFSINFFSSLTLASTLSPDTNIKTNRYENIQNPDVDPNNPYIRTETDFANLFEPMLNSITSILVIICIAMLIYAGFLYIANYTNEEFINKAKKLALSSLIGLFIVMFSYGIIRFILNLSSSF